MIRATICWAGVSGYMAACWRALAARDDVDVRIIAQRSAAPFAEDLLSDLPCRMLTAHEHDDADLIRSEVAQHDPYVVVINGWHRPPYVQLTRDATLRESRFIMAMDTPWQGTWRQRIAPLYLRRLIRQLDGVIVAGDRAADYAQRLGVSDAQLFRGMYGFDYATLAPLHAQRDALPGGWPKGFVYVGRYASTKGIDVLIDAYRQYRSSVSDPWRLTCCGTGEGTLLLEGVPGVEDRGFMQPSELPDVLLSHGAFVVASRFEPWGVVIGEAAASGLPVLCTEACGAAIDIVRSGQSGHIVPTDDAGALAQRMRWCDEHHGELSAMGRSAQSLAEPFSAENWAQRWAEMFERVMGSG